MVLHHAGFTLGEDGATTSKFTGRFGVDENGYLNDCHNNR